ncbi:FAR1 [Candida oxycetoniae]|uniref:FAR1 n=1 Tax=Candida oxycetoniae TaxID=497107 RepID=A0AAI9SXA1_9ASCO|nr:FAR1 [Candida oxycetoniae]KAI3404789.2 FAR1 [Candida oxycetoniae]
MTVKRRSILYNFTNKYSRKSTHVSSSSQLPSKPIPTRDVAFSFPPEEKEHLLDKSQTSNDNDDDDDGDDGVAALSCALESKPKALDARVQTAAELKRFNEEKCCFCNDSLNLVLPGETIVPLVCGHVCHKNCLVLMLSRTEANELPLCGICHVPSRCEDDEVHQSIMCSDLDHDLKLDLQEPSFSSFSSSIVTPTGSFAEEEPTGDSEYEDFEDQLFTPRKQTRSSYALETPPSSVRLADHENLLYTPKISFSTETAEVKLGENNEISYVLNVKAPRIYDEVAAPFNMYEFQLKMKVSNYLKTQLHFNDYLGNLIIFDEMKISVDGGHWDNSRLYLFENHLLFYNDDVLAGIISIENDLCSMTFSNGILNLNLAEISLPELNIMHQVSDIITRKWFYMLTQLKEKLGVPNTNLFQFTSTCWIYLQHYFDISSDLVRFNNLINLGGEQQLPSNYITKVVPSPQSLPLNIVLVVPLYNKSPMMISDTDYKLWIQQFMRNILSFLRPTDSLALILLGIDGNHYESADGVYIGCVNAQWDGWQEIIDSISIVPNQFEHNKDEFRTAFAKFKSLLPFIPSKSSSINKLLILNSCNEDDDDDKEEEEEEEEEEITNHELEIDNALFDDVSVSILKIGKHSTALNSILESFPIEYGAELLIRFDSFEELSASIGMLLEEHFQKICIPKLKITVNAEEDVSISAIEKNGKLVSIEQSTSVIHIANIIPRSERNIIIKVKLCSNFQCCDMESVPVFTYTASWLNKVSNEKTVNKKISIVPETNNAIDEEEKLPQNPQCQDLYYMDIPLFPPLSPSRQLSFTKRQVELLIIEHLRKAIETGESLSLEKCSSLAYGLVRNVSPGFKDNRNDFEEEEGVAAGVGSNNNEANTMFKLLVAIRKEHNDNEKYITYLVKQLQEIISLFSSNQKDAISKCHDILCGLV